MTSSIIGTWRLVSTSARDEAGKAMPLPYGPTPTGLAMFTADGRMIAALSDGRPELPEPGAVREYVSYCGNYSFDGTRLVTQVDGTSDPARIDGEQVREARFEGARLVLTPPPRKTAGGMLHRELVWERVGG